jgi:hypothetical protein
MNLEHGIRKSRIQSGTHRFFSPNFGYPRLRPATVFKSKQVSINKFSRPVCAHKEYQDPSFDG